MNRQRPQHRGWPPPVVSLVRQRMHRAALRRAVLGGLPGVPHPTQAQLRDRRWKSQLLDQPRHPGLAHPQDGDQFGQPEDRKLLQVIDAGDRNPGWSGSGAGGDTWRQVEGHRQVRAREFLIRTVRRVAAFLVRALELDRRHGAQTRSRTAEQGRPRPVLRSPGPRGGSSAQRTSARCRHVPGGVLRSDPLRGDRDARVRARTIASARHGPASVAARQVRLRLQVLGGQERKKPYTPKSVWPLQRVKGFDQHYKEESTRVRP
jgi:hypothetical protein